jgi:hypothetical protein
VRPLGIRSSRMRTSSAVRSRPLLVPSGCERYPPLPSRPYSETDQQRQEPSTAVQHADHIASELRKHWWAPISSLFHLCGAWVTKWKNQNCCAMEGPGLPRLLRPLPYLLASLAGARRAAFCKDCLQFRLQCPRQFSQFLGCAAYTFPLQHGRGMERVHVQHDP